MIDRLGKKLVWLAAVIGMALAIWSTRLGPGVGGDATIYLTSAQNLVKGIGLGLIQPDGSFRLLPYSAPLFPLLLTPFSALHLDLTAAARWINILLFGGMILLAGFASLRYFENKWQAALPAWLLACSPILLPVYSWAMAEPLTLLPGFGGLVFILTNLDRQPTGRIGWLELSGLLFGLSIAARYSAAAFLAAGMLICLFWMAAPLKKRLLAVLRIGLVGFLPLAIWVLVQFTQTASVSSRSILTLAEMRERFLAFWPQVNSALLVWILPASFQESPPYPQWINMILPLTMIVMLAAVSIFMKKRDMTKSSDRLISTLWIFAAVYVGVLLLVYLTTYPPITIDNRMLSPAHVAVIWIAGLLLAQLTGLKTSHLWQTGVFLLAAASILWYGMRTIRIVQQNAETGLGYNALTWRQSQLIEAIKVLPEDQPLVTNETMALLYLTGRVASPVAEIYFDKPVYPFTRYGDGPAGRDPAEARFKAAESLLVVFDTLESQFSTIYGERAKERADVFVQGLHVAAFGDNGAMYYHPLTSSEN
ncbi:MAG: hypothetical protein GYA15_03455 [Leptolinea sp.]|jgi:hypothetical protein|nr:hypothetical protein [Leptolinea sp.]